MEELEVCANMTCEEACCSHERDRNEGLYLSDFCCSYKHFQNHKQLVEHAELDHVYHPEEPSYNQIQHPYDAYPQMNDGNTIAETNTKHHVHILHSGGWQHFNMTGSILAAFVVLALVFFAIYYAIRWRRKYVRIKKNQMSVRHTVIDQHVRLDDLPGEVSSTQLPSSSSQSTVTQTNEKKDLKETPATKSSTPPSYNDLY